LGKLKIKSFNILIPASIVALQNTVPTIAVISAEKINFNGYSTFSFLQQKNTGNI